MNADEEGATGSSEPAADETAQSELDLGVVSTGSAEVDAALHPIESLTERDVAAHPEVFEQVLTDLSRTMTADDSPPSYE